MNLQTHIRPELWTAISNTYESENYTHAIIDAMHYMSDILREKSGAEGDGSSLVGQALGGDSPRLRVNKLQTETEKNIQKGLVQILMGMYSAIRNPRSHEQMTDDQNTADSIIYFINYIIGILDQSQQPFTIDSFLLRVFDPDFVESNRYAELLVAEIPEKRLFDTLIEIYRKKTSGDGRKLKYVIEAIQDRLSESQIREFMDVVSEDLKTVTNDSDIRTTLQILAPDSWSQIHETARLRIEAKLIQYVKGGELYEFWDDETSSWQKRINSKGAIATWARKFFKHFSLGTELALTFIEKLQDSDDDSRRYIVEYFMDSLPDFLITQFVDRCINIIVARVKANDQIIEEALCSAISDYSETWQKMLAEKLKDLTDEENPRMYLPDGTPFLRGGYSAPNLIG